MRARVPRQVDQFGGFAHAANRGFGHRLGLSGECDDRAVMIRIALAVEHQNARHGAHGVNERVHFGRVAPFGEIWHAFDQAFHEPLENCPGQIASRE